MGGRRSFLAVWMLWMNFSSVACLTEPEVCYLLDGILFFYGIILTVLYFRIRITRANPQPPPVSATKPAEEGVYTGLTPHEVATYETVGMNKGGKM